ncbi:unnamed protein product, partial [Ixodes persulcatus]
AACRPARHCPPSGEDLTTPQDPDGGALEEAHGGCWTPRADVTAPSFLGSKLVDVSLGLPNMTSKRAQDTDRHKAAGARSPGRQPGGWRTGCRSTRMAMSTPREARHRTPARRAPHLPRLLDGADGNRDGAPGALPVVAWEGGRPVGLPNGAAPSTPPRRRHPTARPLRRVTHSAAPGFLEVAFSGSPHTAGFRGTRRRTDWQAWSTTTRISRSPRPAVSTTRGCWSADGSPPRACLPASASGPLGAPSPAPHGQRQLAVGPVGPPPGPKHR